MKNPLESEIREILKSIGRDSPEKELNCGTCGYPTCRDKAIAIYRGIADPNMCLPHIMAQTRSFQSNILDNTPNGVIILNEDFEIQVINPKAMSNAKSKERPIFSGLQIFDRKAPYRQQ